MGAGDSPALSQREIVSYSGACRDCGAIFTRANDATVHATGEEHVVDERRRHVVDGRPVEASPSTRRTPA